jgi:hypothetical protein
MPAAGGAWRLCPDGPRCTTRSNPDRHHLARSYYRLAIDELEELLRAAGQVLARTGDAVELCPNYGTATVTSEPAGPPGGAA